MTVGQLFVSYLFNHPRMVLEAFCFQAVFRLSASVHLCMRDASMIIYWKSESLRYLINNLWEFRWIFGMVQLVTKMSWLDSFDQKVKGQGIGEMTLGGNFSPISGMRGHILMKFIIITHC